MTLIARPGEALTTQSDGGAGVAEGTGVFVGAGVMTDVAGTQWGEASFAATW